MKSFKKTICLTGLLAAGILGAGESQAVICGTYIRPVITYTNGVTTYIYGQREKSYGDGWYYYWTTTDPDFAETIQAAVNGDKILYVSGTSTAATCPSTGVARYYGTLTGGVASNYIYTYR